MDDLLATPPVTAAVTPAIDTYLLAKLAREIALEIRELPEILKTFNITPEQYETVVSPAPMFKRALDAARIEWASATSVQKRLTLQAAIGLEDKMPILISRLGDSSEPLNHAVEAAKLLAKVAGVGENAAPRMAGEKFSITINLGADETIKLEKSTVPNEPPEGQVIELEEALQVSTVQPIAGGSATEHALRLIAETPGRATEIQPHTEKT